MQQYFTNLVTVEAIKARYRDLCKQLHPDCGGKAHEFSAMFERYKQALKNLNGSKTTGTDGKQHTYKWDEETETEVHRVVTELLALRMPNVDVFVIGIWVWLAPTPETKNYKEELKKIGMRWNRERECWSWKPAWYRTRKSNASLAALGKKYGAEHFNDDNRKREMVKAS